MGIHRIIHAPALSSHYYMPACSRTSLPSLSGGNSFYGAGHPMIGTVLMLFFGLSADNPIAIRHLGRN